MIELLIVWSVLLTGYSAFMTAYFFKKDKDYRAIFSAIVQTTTAQKNINDSQYSINNTLATNLEILGVHTKLIPPSVSMQAESFLRWHNERKENNDG